MLAVARLVRHESPRYALSGLVGVAFAAFIATRSGKAENFFLPGLLANALYASAFLVSLAVRRPLVGIIVTKLDGEDGTLARGSAPDARRSCSRRGCGPGCSSCACVVQLPLYLAGAVVALGVAKTAMGLPLFALGLWLTWLIVRRHRGPGARVDLTTARARYSPRRTTDDNERRDLMAAESSATTVWHGDLAARLRRGDTGERGVSGDGRQLGVADRARRRQDEPGGAARRRARRLLLHGPLARARPRPARRPIASRRRRPSPSSPARA